MPRECSWGFEQLIPLNAPINTNTVNEDIYPIDKGGPALANNGINRDGGIAELYEITQNIGTGSYAYVTSNGIQVGIDQYGDVFISTQNTQVTPNLYPSNSLYPSNTLYPSGGVIGQQNIGKLNAPLYFTKTAIPSQYLDVVVASSPSGGISSSYTLLGIKFGGSGAYVLDEFDPNTLQIYNSASMTCSITNPGVVCIARANVLTFATLQSTSGFVFNIGNAVYYWKNGTSYSTGKNCDPVSASMSCYYNGGTIAFTTSYQGASHLYTSPSPYTTYTERTHPTNSATGIMMGDFGPNVISASNTVMSIAVTTNSSAAPAFWLNLDASGNVTLKTGFGAISGSAGTTYQGGLYSGGSTEANFVMKAGIITPYGCCGTYYDGTNYGNFHGSTWVVNKTSPTIQPQAYPQLDVVHKMLSLKSYNGQIALLTGVPIGSGDPNDMGNIVNDFAGGTFAFDLAQGNPFQASATAIPGGAKNYYFYPLSFRGVTSTGNLYSGVTVYKLNNGQFVAVNTTTTPQFTEIQPGVISLNTLTAFGAIIDCNYATMYYNYSGYTPSFYMNGSGSTDAHSVMYLKIFNQYSSSIDQGQVYGDYQYLSAMSNTPITNWSAWNGQNGNYIGDFYTGATQSGNAVTTNAIWGNNASHNGGYVFNANIPPGGDALFISGSINMLNAVAIQTQNYFGYYLFAQGGGSALLPWRTASVFILHAIYYACDGTYIYQINLTGGSTGVLAQAPLKMAYAVGMKYLCVSPEKAYFYSQFDNSIYYFDGGQSLNKLIEFNQKPLIQTGVYSVRDDSVYVQTVSSIISIREETERFEPELSINAEALQMTENPLPVSWISGTSKMISTSSGVYFITGPVTATRQYYPAAAGSSLINLNYRTSFMSPSEWMTMQIGRIAGQIYCTSNIAGGTIVLYNYYMLPDGTYGIDTDTQVMTNLNSQGYYRFTWNPPHSNVLASSFAIQHTTSEQKIDLIELVYYYKPDAEAIALNEVQA